MRIISAACVAAVLAASGCGAGTGSSAGSGPDSTSSTSPASPTASSPEENCRRGFTHTPPSDIVVDRAVAAPLSRVKRWVLSTTPEIDWATFSSTLARAPLDERVSVCVVTKRDGSTFDGTGFPGPVESLVTVVRSNGESTVFQLGTLDENLAGTPTTFTGNH